MAAPVVRCSSVLAPPWSQTVTEVIEAEHTLTISGYDLIKGSGSYDPVSSARFTVGGHEWVLLVYPEGKNDPIGAGAAANLHYTPPEDRLDVPPPAAPLAGAAHRQPAPPVAPPGPGNAPPAAPPVAPPGPGNAPAAAGAAPAAGAGQPQQQQQQRQQGQQQQQRQQAQQGAQQAQQPEQEEAAPPVYIGVFAALVGEADTRQGVVVAPEGPIVRVYHQFTLVNQSDPACDFTRGRYPTPHPVRRKDGSVHIEPADAPINMGAAYGDPTSRNVHGYRKFVRQDEMEVPGGGFLVDDTFVIRYKVELLVTRGGGLSRGNADPSHPTDGLKKQLPPLPPSQLKEYMYDLMSNKNLEADRSFGIFPYSRTGGTTVHPFIVMHRSPILKDLMETPDSFEAENKQHVVEVEGMTSIEVVHMVYFMYTGQLWGDDPGQEVLDPAFLPHLLEAGDLYQVEGLKATCEARLANQLTLGNVLERLKLARQFEAQVLKGACLKLVADNLHAFVGTEPWTVLSRDHPELEAQLLEALAAPPSPGSRRISNNSGLSESDRRPWPLLGAVFDRVGIPGPQPDGAVNGRRVRGRGPNGSQQPAANAPQQPAA